MLVLIAYTAHSFQTFGPRGEASTQLYPNAPCHSHRWHKTLPQNPQPCAVILESTPMITAKLKSQDARAATRPKPQSWAAAATKVSSANIWSFKGWQHGLMSGNLQPKGQQSVIFIQSRPLIDLQPIGCLDILCFCRTLLQTHKSEYRDNMWTFVRQTSSCPKLGQDTIKLQIWFNLPVLSLCCHSSGVRQTNLPEVEMRRWLAASKVKGSPGTKLVQHFLFTKFATDPIAHHFLQDWKTPRPFE